MIPIFTENVQGVSSFMSGMILLPGALCNAVVAPIAGHFYDEHGPVIPLFAGFTVILLASIPLVTVNAHTPLWLLTSAYALRMVGNGMIFGPALSEAFTKLSLAENSHGTALNNSLRQCFGAVSVTMLVVISNLPAKLIVGIRTSLWVTVGLTFLMIITFIYYLSVKNHLKE